MLRILVRFTLLINVLISFNDVLTNSGPNFLISILKTTMHINPCYQGQIKWNYKYKGKNHRMFIWKTTLIFLIFVSSQSTIYRVLTPMRRLTNTPPLQEWPWRIFMENKPPGSFLSRDKIEFFEVASKERTEDILACNAWIDFYNVITIVRTVTDVATKKCRYAIIHPSH